MCVNGTGEFVATLYTLSSIKVSSNDQMEDKINTDLFFDNLKRSSKNLLGPSGNKVFKGTFLTGLDKSA